MLERSQHAMNLKSIGSDDFPDEYLKGCSMESQKCQVLTIIKRKLGLIALDPLAHLSAPELGVMPYYRRFEDKRVLVLNFTPHEPNRLH